MWDPYQHADRLGVHVVYRTLRTANGLWVPDRCTIFLQSRLPRVIEKATLAHELGHVCLGHQSSDPRREYQADLWAVRHLIDKDRVVDLAHESSDIGRWACDLDVPAEYMEMWLKHPA